MSDIVEILEHELESAVEVKDKRALHRYVTILVERVVSRKEHEAAEDEVKAEIGGLRGDVTLIAERMQQGFTRMDERFAAVDKRFEDLQKSMDKRFEDTHRTMHERFTAVDKRFNTLVALSSTFFVVLATMMTLMRIFG